MFTAHGLAPKARCKQSEIREHVAGYGLPAVGGSLSRSGSQKRYGLAKTLGLAKNLTGLQNRYGLSKHITGPQTNYGPAKQLWARKKQLWARNVFGNPHAKMNP